MSAPTDKDEKLKLLAQAEPASGFASCTQVGPASFRFLVVPRSLHNVVVVFEAWSSMICPLLRVHACARIYPPKHHLPKLTVA